MNLEEAKRFFHQVADCYVDGLEFWVGRARFELRAPRNNGVKEARLRVYPKDGEMFVTSGPVGRP